MVHDVISSKIGETLYHIFSQKNIPKWLTFLLASMTVTLTVLLLWIPTLIFSSDANICSTMSFTPLENSGHVAFSVSTNFLSKSKRVAPFHQIAYDYSHADCESL